MAVQQLSQGSPDGAQLGSAATELVGFWGKTARIRITAIASISSAETTANVKTRLRLLITGLKNIGIVG
jgi:hypothetical protein